MTSSTPVSHLPHLAEAVSTDLAPLDLDAIEGRVQAVVDITEARLYELLSAEELGAALRSAADVPALVAEVRRLSAVAEAAHRLMVAIDADRISAGEIADLRRAIAGER